LVAVPQLAPPLVDEMNPTLSRQVVEEQAAVG
jgi:hypothetical protein